MKQRGPLIRLNKWLRARSKLCDVDELDDIHVDEINPRWRPKGKWLHACKTVAEWMASGDLLIPRGFHLSLGIHLIYGKRRVGLRNLLAGGLAANLDEFTPPSLYVIRHHGKAHQHMMTHGKFIKRDLLNLQHRMWEYWYLEYKERNDVEWRRSLWIWQNTNALQ